jgi:lysophospholipase L1-like esterase
MRMGTSRSRFGSAIRLSLLCLGGLLVASTGFAQAGYYTVTPCRLLDTRQPTGPQGGPPLLAAQTRIFPAASHCGIPANATAAFLNVTVVGPSASGYVQLFPAGTPLPLASSLNYTAGQIRANNGVFALGTSGQLAIFAGQASGTADAVVDVSGYFLDPSQSSVTVNITPASVGLVVNETQTFTCNVSAVDKSCSWSLQEGPGSGTVTPTGPTTSTYTAPAQAGTYHVIATSNAAPTRSSAATVSVVDHATGAPMPLISRFPGVQAFASNDPTGTLDTYGANRARDNVYFGYGHYWRAPYPAWVAYDLSPVPLINRGPVLVAMYNESFSYGGIVGRAGGTYSEPGDYTIEGNAAAGGTPGAPTSGWVALVSVAGNTVHSRSHILNLTGYNWIRFHATAGNPANEVQNTDAEIKLEVWDAHLGNTDSWAFLGDSVVAGGMTHDKSAAPNFAQTINAALPSHFPMYENAGNGFDGAEDFGLIRLNTLLGNSQARYIAICYGQNDAGGTAIATNYDFYNAYKAIVDAVLAAGRIPAIPTISWTGRHPMQDILGDPITGSQYTFNRQLTKLKEDYRALGKVIIEGPDLWTFFKNNPDLIKPDDDHPTDDGYVAMQNLWAQAALANVYPK